MRHQFSLYLFLLLNSLPVLVAQPLLQLDEMKQKYSGQMAVYIQESENVLIDFRKDSIIATVNQKEDLLLLTDKAQSFAEKKIYYSHFTNIIGIEAQTLVPETRKYKSIKVTSIKEKQESSRGIFYDDLRSKNFIFPAVQPGARTVLNFDREIIDPRLFNSFYFGSSIPTEESAITITVNKAIKLNYRLYNAHNLDLQYSSVEKGNYVTHSWKTANLPSYPYESNAPASSYYLPHLIYYLEEAGYANGKKPILKSLDDLHNWYYTFVQEIVEANYDGDSEMKTVVDSIIKGAKNDIEKVKRIFYWVQDNISYVAFEAGYRGFIPYKAPDTFQKRYGDCKDLSSITYTMLKIAGVKSYLTWIGSRDLPYRYTDIPTPSVDNHMIVAYMQDDQIYFLDATSRYTRFGLPSSMIQGKEALISIDRDHYLIKEVPVMEPEKNMAADTMYMEVVKKQLKFKANLVMDGYPKILNAYELTGKTYDKQKEALTIILRRGSNKFFLDSLRIENLLEREKPLAIRYEGYVEDYVKEIDSEIYINMNLDKSYSHETIDTSVRKAPMESEFKFKSVTVNILSIPKGYRMEYLPENIIYEDELFSFSIKYESKNGKIFCNKIIFMNYLILDKQDFKAWNRMVEKISEAYREVVILKAI